MQAFVSINSPGAGETLDKGLALRFPGPASFTGQSQKLLYCNPSPTEAPLTAWPVSCNGCSLGTQESMSYPMAHIGTSAERLQGHTPGHNIECIMLVSEEREKLKAHAS